MDRTEPDEHGKTAIRRLSAVDQLGRDRYQWPRGAKGPQASSHDRSQSNPAPNTNQGANAGGGTSKDQDKPWYNNLKNDRDSMVDAIADSKVTPEQIIEELEQKFKLSKTTRDAIKALG